MNNVPSFFHIKPPGTSLNNRFNHSGNTDVQNPEVKRNNYNCTENDQCIVLQFFTARPANLFEFTPALSEKGKQRLETTFHADYTSKRLSGFAMRSLLVTELAKFLHLQAVGVISLVFGCCIVSLFATCTSQSDNYPHDVHLPKTYF